MSGAVKRSWLVLFTVTLVLLAGARAAHSHRLAPSLLELRELGRHRVAVRWRTPLLQPTGARLRPQLPSQCRQVQAPWLARSDSAATYQWLVDCGTEGLTGSTLQITGLQTSKTSVLVRAVLADGRIVRALLDGHKPVLAIPAAEKPRDVGRRYVSLGIRYLGTGVDHLLFILGLVLLASGTHRLWRTITAFAAGHSLTLALSVLGFAGVPAAPAKAAIALTILFVALELTRDAQPAPSLARRYLWIVAFAFGLIHGLGFAGALAQLGLPPGKIPLALLGFNAGIEIGQLGFAGLVLGAAAAWRVVALRLPAWAAQGPAYAIGSLAAYWCIERTVGLL